MQRKPGFFILHEMRLSASDRVTHRRVAKCLADLPATQEERLLPLFRSIDDRHDVACVRRVMNLPNVDDRDEIGECLQEGLAPEAEHVAAPRYYTERAAMVGENAFQSYYRMAVTESGINEEVAANALADEPVGAPTPRTRPGPGAAAAGLLWIGRPVSSATGLLVITGHSDATDYRNSEPSAWPLPTSRQLGVRIYEGGEY